MEAKQSYEELETKIIALENEAERCRRAEKTLRESEQRFRLLSDIAEDGIMITEKGKIIDGNSALARLFGYDPAEMIGMQAIELAAPESRDKIWDYRHSGYGKTYEISGLQKDGSVIHCRTLGKPYSYKGKTLRVTLITDVSDFKKAEAALKKQTLELHNRVRELNCLLSISQLVQKPHLTEDEVLQGVVNLIPSSFQHPEKICARFTSTGRMYMTSKFKATLCCVQRDVLVHTKKIGLLEVCRVNLESRGDGWRVLNEKQHIINAVAERLGKIIELREAYRDIMESERKYRSVFENSGGPAVIFERDMTIHMANPEFEKMTGYSKAELNGKMNWADFVSETDLNKMKRLMLEIQSKGRSASATEYECELQVRHGQSRTVAFKIGIIPGEKRTIVSLTDITDRKRTETTLRSREEFLRKQNQRLKSSMKGRYQFAEIIGQGPAMQAIYDLILKAAGANAPTIIYGESGTGKELVARAIHDMSDRFGKKFITINCGAIPESILESELFGYKKGAFTGAHSNKSGLLDAVDDGTLFMDEIGDISLNMQVKLLRAIEGGGYTPVGSNQLRRADIRIVAATNKDLADMVQQGLMREDFYYRINIIPIRIPPLRERKEDIPLLVNHFLKKFSSKGQPPRFTGKLLDMLHSYDWPGNVRELQNVLHRYVTLDRIDFAGISPQKNQPSLKLENEPMMNLPKSSLRNALRDYEKKYILEVLEQNHWQRGTSASILQINRRTLYGKMRQLRLISK